MSPRLKLSRRPLRVAVCICTYRRQELLRELLRHIRTRCDLPAGTKVVVADNECSGTTQEIVQTELPDAYYLGVEVVGISAARNAVTKFALNLDIDALVYLDDDDRPHTDWLIALIEHQARFGHPLVFGGVQERYDIVARRCRGTCNCLVTRQAFELIGQPYFDPRLNLVGGEDGLFFDRIEEAVAQAAHAKLSVVTKSVQDERYTWRSLFTRAFSQGYRHVYIARLMTKHKSRSAFDWWLHQLVRFLRALLFLPLKFWKVRAYRKVWENFAAFLGASFASMGGKFEYYAEESSR